MSWTLGAYSLADLNVTNVVRRCQSQAIDTLTCDAAMAGDANPLWSFGQTVVLKKDGVNWFYGTVTKPTGAFSGLSESQNYEVSGPWWHLERIPYQQRWTNADGTYSYKSRVLLGQDQDGNKITTGTQIQDAVNWAIGSGAPLQLGDLPGGVDAPVDEVNSLTCGEVLKRLLKWTPDWVAWFDYSTAPPTLNFTPRGSLSPSLASFSSLTPTSLRIYPRNDLLCPAVVLNFERNDNIDGQVVVDTEVDAYPSGATGRAAGAIVQTIELGGASMSFQKQPIKTRPLPGPGAADSVLLDYFYKVCPDLRKMKQKNLEVVSHTFDASLAPGQTDDYGYDLPDWDTGDLPNELLNGSVTQWMKDADVNLKVAPLELSVYLSYTDTPKDADADEKALAQSFFSMSDKNSPNYNIHRMTHTVVATNAITKVYSQLTSFTEEEPSPSGLAAHFYTVLNALHYEGSIELVEEECSGSISVGTALNISGGNTAWASMNAVVQTVTETLDTGRTAVEFGPPQHLTPQDLVELLRAGRNRNVSYRQNQRTTGISGTVPQTEGSGAAPNAIAHSTILPAQYPWMGQTLDTIDPTDWSLDVYAAWFGDGNASFATADSTKNLKQFQLRVFDPEDDNASQFFLTVGDDDTTKDGLIGMYGGATAKLTWGTESDSKPQLWLKASDGTQATLSSDELLLENSDGTDRLDISMGADGSTPTIHCGTDITLASGDITLTTDGKFIVGDSKLEDGDLTIHGSDPTIHCGTDITLANGDITLTTDGKFIVGDSKLEDGDLTIGGSDPTLHIGEDITFAYGDMTLTADGKVQVGDSVLTDGDLNLGATGTVTIDSKSFSPQQIWVCVIDEFGHTTTQEVWVLAQL